MATDSVLLRVLNKIASLCKLYLLLLCGTQKNTNTTASHRNIRDVCRVQNRNTPQEDTVGPIKAVCTSYNRDCLRENAFSRQRVRHRPPPPHRIMSSKVTKLLHLALIRELLCLASRTFGRRWQTCAAVMPAPCELEPRSPCSFLSVCKR